MCMQPTHVAPWQKWRWAGDEPFHDTVIEAMRRVPVPGGKRYPIDIREFLSIEGNAVVRGALETISKRVPRKQVGLFWSHAPGSFDLRKDIVLAHFAETVRYEDQGQRDVWQFPDETLAAGAGDCEDRAFLLAALLEAAGISPYCLRVALGTLVERGPGRRRRPMDHVWVMYLGEDGVWEILEPHALAAPARRGRPHKTDAEVARTVEYVPRFVFNRHHLWRVRSDQAGRGEQLQEYARQRRFWDDFDPSFAQGVHEGIFDEALWDMDADQRRSVKRTSLWVDVDTIDYDPRDHFDFAYIDPSWQRVARRLASRKIEDFALAAHAIADFYAHTVYGSCAGADPLPVYDPAQPLPAAQLQYDFNRFASLPGCRSNKVEAARSWSGELISGQWWRWYSTFPDDLQARKQDLAHRRCLPDHDQVAVDSPDGWAPGHMLDGPEYARQFRLRRSAAVRHVRQAWLGWRG